MECEIEILAMIGIASFSGLSLVITNSKIKRLCRQLKDCHNANDRQAEKNAYELEKLRRLM